MTTRPRPLSSFIGWIATGKPILEPIGLFAPRMLSEPCSTSAQMCLGRGAEQGSNDMQVAVVKRSYSRAIFRSFCLTQSHSFSGCKSLIFCCEICEARVSIEGAELASNQIPPSAPSLISSPQGAVLRSDRELLYPSCPVTNRSLGNS